MFTSIFASIYALLSLGLNLQWGYTGLFNVGVAGFYAIGAYSSALLTTPLSPYHLGGFHLPIPVGMLGAMLTSGLLAYVVGKPTLRLREDYLAIATISIAETLRLLLKNEAWLTNGGARSTRYSASFPTDLRRLLRCVLSPLAPADGRRGVPGERATHTLALGPGAQGHSGGRGRGCQCRERCVSL